MQYRWLLIESSIILAYNVSHRGITFKFGLKTDYGEIAMAFDFKKEYKEFYMPKSRSQIVTIPKANYIAVRGKGNPNEETI